MNEDSPGMVALIRQRLAGMLGVTHNGARDTYAAFGWPATITTQQLMQMYLRNGIASRIIRAFPQATWSEIPTIRDGKGDSGQRKDKNGKVNPSYSPFVEAVENLFESTKMFHFLERADRLSGIGQFGLLLLGFDGAEPLNTPLSAGAHKLLYLSAYAQIDVTVTQWDTNPTSPRYALPVLYSVRPGSLSGAQPVSVGSRVIHYSRVIHLVEHLDQNDVFGTPRLHPIYNHLTDLEKVLGSSSETFWLNARSGLALTADKDAVISDTGLKDMQEQAFEFEHQLRRTLALKGVSAQMLNANIADPEPNVDKLLDVIAGGAGVPKRILIGSEAGQLASTQDDDNWASRIDERQNGYVSPMILRPLIDTLINTGNLPKPDTGYWIEWPESNALSPQALADIGVKKADAISKYASSASSEMVVPIEEFRTDILGMSPTSEYVTEEEPIDESDQEVVAAFGDPGAVSAEVPADTALNGAQIASLQSIVLAVGDGTLEPESAINLIRVGFPTITEELAKAIIDPMAKAFEADRKERAKKTPDQLVVPPGIGAGGPGADAPAEDSGDVPPNEDTVQAQTVRAATMISNHLKVNARPRTLYVYRKVLNADAVRKHYAAQGFDKMVAVDDMHVTIAFSRAQVDWMKIGTDWQGDSKTGVLLVSPGGARINEMLGRKRDVLTLLFSSSPLSWRHEEICRAGASWEWPSYEPHITITYDAANEDVENIVPYGGPIELGPEIFEEVKEDWTAKENADNREVI